MYSKGGGRGRFNLKNYRKHYPELYDNGKPNLGYIFRHEDDDLIDFDNVYKLNSSCVNVLGIVAVETFLCFGKFYLELMKYNRHF